jgi:hypothetical protein
MKIRKEQPTQKVKTNEGARKLPQPVFTGLRNTSGGPAGGFTTGITSNRTTGKY